MADDRFQVDITAKDATAAVMEGVTERMARLGHEVEHVQKHIDGLHRPSMWNELHEHVSILHERFGGLRLSLGEVVNQARELVPVLGGITIGAGLEQLFETTEQTAERFSVLKHEAETIGTTANRLNDLRTMADMSDTSIEKLEMGLGRMNITLGKVMTGSDKEAASLLKHLHIDPTQFHDSTDALIRFADVFERIHHRLKPGVANPLEARIAEVMFGGRGGREVIPIMEKGGDWMREHMAEADRHNFNPDAEQGENNERYNESMKGLKASVQGLRDSIGTELAPVLQPVIKEMDDWVISNRAWVSTAITSDVKILGSTLKAVDWHQIGEDARWAADGIDYVVEKTTGWQHLLEGVAAYWMLKGAFKIFGEPIMKFKEIGEEAVAFGGKLAALVTGWDRVGDAAKQAAVLEEAAVKMAPGVGAAELAASRGGASVAAGVSAEGLSAPVAEVAAGAAGATVLSRVAGAGRLAARVLTGPELIAGYIAHSVDSEDQLGQWIDRNVPGAAGVDSWFARHTGGAIGRLRPGESLVGAPSSAEGAFSGPEDDLGLPFVYSSPPSTASNAPAAERSRVDGEIRVSLDISGAPDNARTFTQVTGSDLLTANVNLGQAWPR